MNSVVPEGYVYSKNGAMQHTGTTGYGADGRINSAIEISGCLTNFMNSLLI